MSRRLAAVVAALALLLTGCQGAYDLPLPGGAARESGAYRVTVEFADVLDLVPQSAVKVDDVTVGAVEDITLDGWTARVVVRLAPDVDLPDNAVAELRQTSLLGEKFVSLSAPAAGGEVGRLSDGDVIPLDRSGRNPEVEEVLGALALVLNGGAVGRVQTINRELGDALEGREGDVRSVLTQLDVLVTGLDDSRADIVDALDAVDRLSASLAAQQQDIATAVDTIPGGLAVLEDQRADLVAMLTALSDLGVTATRVIDASQADTVASLQALDPVLTQLAAAGDALPESLSLLLTYPFPDAAADAVHGNYTNLNIDLSLSLADLAGLLPAPTPPPTTPTVPVPPLPTLPTPPVTVPDVCQLVGTVLPACDPGALTDQLCAGLGLPGACDALGELCDQLDPTAADGCTLPTVPEICSQLPVLGPTLCPPGSSPPPTTPGQPSPSPSPTPPGGICIPLPLIPCIGTDGSSQRADSALGRLMVPEGVR